jgi:hypothetical protein
MRAVTVMPGRSGCFRPKASICATCISASTGQIDLGCPSGPGNVTADAGTVEITAGRVPNR